MKGYPKLKGYLKEKGITQDQAAQTLQIKMKQFNNKLNGRSDFTMTEVKLICEWLNVKADIFLN
jgi:putative transcriptional regulator